MLYFLKAEYPTFRFSLLLIVRKCYSFRDNGLRCRMLRGGKKKKPLRVFFVVVHFSFSAVIDCLLEGSTGY